MAISAYAIRRALRAPRAHFRRRHEANPEPVLEHFQYSQAIYAFLRADRGRVERGQPGLLVDFDVNAESLVLDVGAYVGTWSEQLSHLAPARIYAFEPNPESLAHMRIRMVEFPNVSILDYGLGGRDATAALSLQGMGSSIYDDSHGIASATINIRDIAVVLDELELDHIDIVKLNIEGGEYDLLDRLIETNWLPRIEIVAVQFHEWLPKAHRRRKSIRRALSATHTPIWDYPWVWEAWRNQRTT